MRLIRTIFTKRVYTEQRLNNCTKDQNWLNLQFKSCDSCFTTFTQHYTVNRDEATAFEIRKQIIDKTDKARPYDLRKQFPDCFILPLTRKRMTADLVHVNSPRMIPIDSTDSLPSVRHQNNRQPSTTNAHDGVEHDEYYRQASKRPDNVKDQVNTNFYLREFAYQHNKSVQLLHRIQKARPSATMQHTEYTHNTCVNTGACSNSGVSVERKISIKKRMTPAKSSLMDRQGSGSPFKSDNKRLLSTSKRPSEGMNKIIPIWEGSEPPYQLYGSQSNRLHKKLKLISASSAKLRSNRDH